MSNIVLENSNFKLVIDESCMARNLILKASGEELLAEQKCPCFSVTQNRPFNNEIKLIYMNKRTTYNANRVRQEGDRLIVGFELAPYEAAIKVTVTDSYISFTLDEFIVQPENYSYLKMDTPPAVEFRLMQLPVKNRENFGKWLNVMWDGKVAVNLLSTTPHARIDSELREGYRILTADAVKGIKLRGCTVALIVSEKDSLFDCIDSLEVDYNIPRGVKSRRGELINSSIYWSLDITPETVDEHIKYMKKGGFKLALIYYLCMFDFTDRYGYCNEFKFRKEYVNGVESLKEMLAKIKAAGIIPGIHFLHTHIGVDTHYVTPHADRRLNLTRKFTLAKPLGLDDTVIYVDEDPTDTVMCPECRVLKFGTELIRYESYTTERPYRFIGCQRGEYKTEIISHGLGEIGGVLDLSEFTATSVYLDQNTDLQDEIADKLAEVYNSGFEFVYYDGSEGTNAPYEFHVPNAQLRVYNKLGKAPLFCEGAAKSHFSWHILSGANAFDRFKTCQFKEMIDKFPVVAAKEMQNDFTRVNFGWWEIWPDTRPDVYEYGMMRAIAYNCPSTVIARRLTGIRTCALLDDSLEAMRRWEDAKCKGFFTEELKQELRASSDEHTLLINEEGEYELCRHREVKTPIENLYAFVFSRGGASYASLCYVGEGVNIKLPIAHSDIAYLERDLITKAPVSECEGGVQLSVSNLRYIKTNLSEEALEKAIGQITLI